MIRRPLFFLIVLSVALTGCAHKLTQQEKDDFLALQDKAAMGAKKSLPPSSTTRIPLKAGQWAVVANHFKDAKGDYESMGFTKYKIIRLSGDTLTMEIESNHAGQKGPTVMAYVVDHFPVGKQISYTKEELDKFVDKLEFKRIITKIGDHPPSELPIQLVPLTRTYIKNLFLTGYRIGAMKAEPCASDVYSSKKCLGYDYQVDLPGYKGNGHVDAHSAIPVVGFVKLHDDQAESRVINFGMSGAKGILIQ